MPEGRYVIMKVEAIWVIIETAIKAGDEGNMAAFDAYENCLNIIREYQYISEDF